MNGGERGGRRPPPSPPSRSIAAGLLNGADYATTIDRCTAVPPLFRTAYSASITERTILVVENVVLSFIAIVTRILSFIEREDRNNIKAIDRASEVASYDLWNSGK